MAGQAGEDTVESVIEDGSAAEWAVRRAEELDLEPHEFLERIMQAYRAAEAGGQPDPPGTEEIDRVEARIESLEGDVAEMIEDVRQRVIQVKRETDGKAPADHDHDRLEDRLDDVEGDVTELKESVETLEDRLTGGFDNFEEILEFLVERTDDLSEDIETLGNAIISLRETMEEVTGREQSRNLAARLKTKAAKRGIRTAKCEECGSKIDLGLLSSASCPVCDASFQDIDPDPGFFGRSTLETGSRPALEAPSEGPDPDEIASVASGETHSEAPDREGLFPSEDELEGAQSGTDLPGAEETGEDTNE